MISSSNLSPEFAQLQAGNSRSSVPAANADKVIADTRFLYRLLWGLIAATLIAGAVAAALAGALVPVSV
ncbi:MAG: hypothetical protein ACOC9Q_00955 [bacterium]